MPYLQGTRRPILATAPAISTDGMVAHWKLDEASGTRYDSYGTNDLTDNNTVTRDVGRINYAAQFVATNSEYLSIADNPALSMGDIDFTIACWVNLASKGANRWIIAKGTADTVAGREYGLLFINSTDRLQFYVSDGTTSVGVSANLFGSVPLATWLFVACWHNATANTIHIQVNNGGISQNSTTNGPQDGIGPFVVGVNSSTLSFWDGLVDSMSVYKRRLATRELTHLYNRGRGRNYPFRQVFIPYRW